MLYMYKALNGLAPHYIRNMLNYSISSVNLLPNEFLLIDLKKITRVYEYEYSTMSMNI